MVRGERPIKLRDSWFSTKSILVECFITNSVVELFFSAGVFYLPIF